MVPLVMLVAGVGFAFVGAGSTAGVGVLFGFSLVTTLGEFIRGKM